MDPEAISSINQQAYPPPRSARPARSTLDSESLDDPLYSFKLGEWKQMLQPEQRLEWETLPNSGEKRPIWPPEPNMFVLGKIAFEHLPRNFANGDPDPFLITVKYLHQRTNYKAYEIQYGGQSTNYVIRVSLPVDPIFKTESEVATMRFLKTYTTIPVPEVVAWDSFSHNSLGFEWIMMKNARGRLLSKLWSDLTQDERASFFGKLGKCAEQLRGCPFPCIGSLYLKSSEPRVYIASIETTSHDLVEDNLDCIRETVNPFEDLHSYPGFIIGRMVKSPFDVDSRLHVNAYRGPFENSVEWMAAEVLKQIRRLRKYRDLNGRDNSEQKKDLAGAVGEMEKGCVALSEELPEFYWYDKKGEHPYILHSGHLLKTDIYIDEDTLEISDITNWEATYVCPLWKATVDPKILQDLDPRHSGIFTDEDKGEDDLTEAEKLEFYDELAQDPLAGGDLVPAYYRALQCFRDYQKAYENVGKYYSTPFLEESLEIKRVVETIIEDIGQFWDREGRWRDPNSKPRPGEQLLKQYEELEIPLWVLQTIYDPRPFPEDVNQVEALCSAGSTKEALAQPEAVADRSSENKDEKIEEKAITKGQKQTKASQLIEEQQLEPAKDHQRVTKAPGELKEPEKVKASESREPEDVKAMKAPEEIKAPENVEASETPEDSNPLEKAKAPETELPETKRPETKAPEAEPSTVGVPTTKTPTVQPQNRKNPQHNSRLQNSKKKSPRGELVISGPS